VRFLLSEVARQPADRGLLFVGPGEGLAAALAQGLESLTGVPARTKVVVISETPKPDGVDSLATWLPPPEGCHPAPFLVRYSDGAVYALVRDEKVGTEGARMYHTDDRSVVEFLAFRLQRELALPELV